MVSALPRPSEAISLRVCAASVFPADKTNDDTSIRTRQKATKPYTRIVFCIVEAIGINLAARVCGQRVSGSRTGRVPSVGGSAMHMKMPDGIRREAGIGKTQNGEELSVYRACPW